MLTWLTCHPRYEIEITPQKKNDEQITKFKAQ